MESLLLSINAIAPIFVLMLIGYFIKSIKLLEKKVFDGINTLVFNLLLPALLFYNVYSTDTIESFNLKIFLFTIFSIIAVFIIGILLVILISKDNSKRGVMLQGIFRSNFAILGIPLLESLFDKNLTSLTYLMVAIIIPLFNVLAVLSFELFNKESSSFNLLSLLKNIIKNPLIIACALGLLMFFSGIKLPHFLEKSVSQISSAATPLALITLGAGFSFKSIKGSKKEIITVSLLKLIFVPLLIISAAVLFGFKGEALGCLMVISGAPIAVSSFPMAKSMGGDEELAASTIVVTSALCILTLFGWIYLLSSLSLF